MPVVPFSSIPSQASRPKPDDPMILMAAAQMQSERPMDITSLAQKADLQKTAKDWPEGTSSYVRKTYDDALKSGGITQDQYNKAMRDPRQFQPDQ